MPQVSVNNPQALKEFVGREIGLSDWFEVSRERIAQFAEATEDRQWIHLDQARTETESPFGTIAHGFLTLSLISRLLREVIAIRGEAKFAVNYGLNRVRFPAAVKSGDRIRARVSLLALRESDGFVEVTYSVTIESADSPKPNCVAEWVLRYYV